MQDIILLDFCSNIASAKVTNDKMFQKNFLLQQALRLPCKERETCSETFFTTPTNKFQINIVLQIKVLLLPIHSLDALELWRVAVAIDERVQNVLDCYAHASVLHQGHSQQRVQELRREGVGHVDCLVLCGNLNTQTISTC
jgi:hypothetical protein